VLRGGSHWGVGSLGRQKRGDAKDAIAALALTHWLAACKGGNQASEASAIFFFKAKKNPAFRLGFPLRG